MSYSLVEAAIACGVNRSTVLRAIKASKISTSKDEQGEWRIEPAELHRVYPPVQANEARPERAHQETLIAEHATPSPTCGEIVTSGGSRRNVLHCSRPRQSPCSLSPNPHRSSSRHAFAALGAGCGRRGDPCRKNQRCLMSAKNVLRCGQQLSVPQPLSLGRVHSRVHLFEPPK